MAETNQGSQSAAKSRRKALDVRVMLDTNQLFTGSASDLLRQELADLIRDSKRHKDIQLTWYLPEVVRLERRYQMLQAATELLPQVTKLERLLGTGIGVTAEILAQRVDAAIARQITELVLRVYPLDEGKVNWCRLIADAAGRQPPFDAGKHEKGFRDAVVAETFLQLVEASPRTPSVCRVVLVTGDASLTTAVQSRTADTSDVRVVASLDLMRDLINTVVADITEDFVKGIRDAAQALFFAEEEKSSLYYSAGVREAIKAKFSAELATLPPGAETRRGGTWYISPPRFSTKAGQRVHWVSTIKATAKAFKKELFSSFGLSPLEQAFLPPSELYTITLSTGLHTPFSIEPSALGTLFAPVESSGAGAPGLFPKARTREVQVAEGFTAFEVAWSVTVTTSKQLRRPSVDGITLAGTTWETAVAA